MYMKNKINLINEIEKLIEAKRLWIALSNTIEDLSGGDFYSGKYSEIYNYYESLIYDLIVSNREFITPSNINNCDDDLINFSNNIYDLALNSTDITIESLYKNMMTFE